MAEWGVQYPVDYVPNGDKTKTAIAKHINEIARLYGLLGMLRANFTGAGYPDGPVRNQLYINPNTLVPKVYVGLSGANDWRDLICVPGMHDLDKHNAGDIADLQALVTDAVIVALATAPGASDNGKVLAIDANGNVVLASGVAPGIHGPDKHSAMTLAQLQGLVSDETLLAIGTAPAADDAGKLFTVGADGTVTLSTYTLAALLSRISTLETQATSIPVMESVAALPETPDPDTWYFVQES